MKYTLEKFFEELEPIELDEIMPDNLEAKLSKKALKRIEKTALQKAGLKNNTRRFNVKIFAPAAACLLLTATIGGTAIAAEAKEYNAAVDFFKQNGLSSEGLSREDIKAVYHDITTNRFMNDKTVEVIRRSVPGVEILQENPTPEELSDLWNLNTQDVQLTPPKHIGIEYIAWTKFKNDETLHDLVFDKSIVECYNNGETIWSTEISSFCVDDCTLTSNGTAAWGSTDIGASPAWLARLDDSGNKLWERQLDHGFEYESVAAVLDNSDGTWSVISSGDKGDIDYLCFARFDINGNELEFKKSEVGCNWINNVIRLGDGYLVQLRGVTMGFIMLDSDGNVTDNFVYENEDSNYHITDMTEFEGNVYISAYAVPKQTGYLIDMDYMRDTYTAVLLLFDPKVGEPKIFYSVKGSFGGALAVENDQLKWNVESFASVFAIPEANSYDLCGNCLVYRYSFDNSGIFAGYEDTGEVTFYRILRDVIL